LVLTTVWDSENAFSAWWATGDSGGLPELKRLVEAPAAVNEFYRQDAYGMVDGLWLYADADESVRRIVWPARGAVRIVIQYAIEPNPEAYERIAVEVADTRREAGCAFYDWLVNVELPDHLALVELWTDQVRYDRHSQLRVDSAAYRGDPLRRRRPPERGPVAIEFYRQQSFVAQYGRWLPADVDQYATSVRWAP
jgi:quinol monooxygenase YgiN